MANKCTWCDQDTQHHNARQCDNCHEMEIRIAGNPALASKILASHTTTETPIYFHQHTTMRTCTQVNRWCAGCVDKHPWKSNAVAIKIGMIVNLKDDYLFCDACGIRVLPVHSLPSDDLCSMYTALRAALLEGHEI